jgi:hypothetical protein
MPIAYVYETEQQAQDAAQKLSSRYPESAVHLITPSSGGDAAAALKSGGFEASDAAAFAAEIARGRSVVAANPSFGQGVVVKSILDEFGPIPMGPLPSSYRDASARYTPFSEALGLSLLTRRTQQAWFWGDQLKRPDVSSLGFPRLKRNYNLSFGIPRLKRNYDLSFGIARLLKNNPTPLSSMLGLPLSKPPGVASLGLPRLVKRG